MEKEGFVKLSRSLGQFRMGGLLSMIQLSLITSGFFVSVAIDYRWQIGVMPASLIVSGFLIPVAMVIGERPDRILRQLLHRPRKWKRGFEPARPILSKKTRYGREHGKSKI